ncbi:hypothetical protein QFZ66_002078 [Streptomyces sp. B4I13]|nr:hypothetical protein [Streptomyces sp. B4I13]
MRRVAWTDCHQASALRRRRSSCERHRGRGGADAHPLRIRPGGPREPAARPAHRARRRAGESLAALHRVGADAATASRVRARSVLRLVCSSKMPAKSTTQGRAGSSDCRDQPQPTVPGRDSVPCPAQHAQTGAVDEGRRVQVQHQIGVRAGGQGVQPGREGRRGGDVELAAQLHDRDGRGTGVGPMDPTAGFCGICRAAWRCDPVGWPEWHPHAQERPGGPIERGVTRVVLRHGRDRWPLTPGAASGSGWNGADLL